jgi:tetratricopeptide (TPR) repeat protein
MTTTAPDWERRIADLWKTLDDRTEDDFLARMQELVAELPADNAPALFEQACAFDSTGHSDRAVPLYRQALRIGLTGVRRRRAVIQMASSLRNLDRATESVALLTAELSEPSDELDDAVRAVLALALVDTGRERDAVALALTALARHLPRYQRSMTNYARMLVDASAADILLGVSNPQ